MEEALRLIIAKSPNAAPFALRCLAAIRSHSPVVQQRYTQTLEIALADPAAHFSAEDRAVLAAAIQDVEPAAPREFTLRVRLSEAERSELQRLADEAGMGMSEYVRRRLFGPQL